MTSPRLKDVHRHVAAVVGEKPGCYDPRRIRDDIGCRYRRTDGPYQVPSLVHVYRLFVDRDAIDGDLLRMVEPQPVSGAVGESIDLMVAVIFVEVCRRTCGRVDAR